MFIYLCIVFPLYHHCLTCYTSRHMNYFTTVLGERRGLLDAVQVPCWNVEIHYQTIPLVSKGLMVLNV